MLSSQQSVATPPVPFGAIYKIREPRQARKVHISEHTGLIDRGLYSARSDPGHQPELFHCRGNVLTCPAHRFESIERYKARLELITTTTTYLEEIRLTSELECATARKRVQRADGIQAVIVLGPKDFRMISTVPVGGVQLPPTAGRIDYLNELAERAPRELGRRAVRFGKKWPKLDDPRADYERIGSHPDEADETSSDAELCEKSIRILERLQIHYPDIRWRRDTAVTATGTALRLHINLPLEILADPPVHERIHTSLGYHSVDPRFYQRAAQAAREKLKLLMVHSTA